METKIKKVLLLLAKQQAATMVPGRVKKGEDAKN